MILSSTLSQQLRPSTSPTYVCGQRQRQINHYRKGNYNPDQVVCSSVQRNGIRDIYDRPGGYMVSPHGNIKTSVVYPSPLYPSEIVALFNPEKKAITRSRGASTLINRKYHNTIGSYQHARGYTYEQNEFHYNEVDVDDNAFNRSNSVVYSFDENGSPQPCHHVIYSRNNAQFGTQGAVSNSARLMKFIR